MPPFGVIVAFTAIKGGPDMKRLLSVFVVIVLLFVGSPVPAQKGVRLYIATGGSGCSSQVGSAGLGAVGGAAVGVGG